MFVSSRGDERCRFVGAYQIPYCAFHVPVLRRIDLVFLRAGSGSDCGAERLWTRNAFFFTLAGRRGGSNLVQPVLDLALAAGCGHWPDHWCKASSRLIPRGLECLLSSDSASSLGRTPESLVDLDDSECALSDTDTKPLKIYAPWRVHSCSTQCLRIKKNDNC